MSTKPLLEPTAGDIMAFEPMPQPVPSPKVSVKSTKSLAQIRLEWLDHVARDNGLNDAAFRVGAVLNGYLNQKSLTAFPHISTIAKIMGISEQTVSDAIKRLVERGHVIKSKSGIRNNNEYRFDLGSQRNGRRYSVRKLHSNSQNNPNMKIENKLEESSVVETDELSELLSLFLAPESELHMESLPTALQSGTDMTSCLDAFPLAEPATTSAGSTPATSTTTDREMVEPACSLDDITKHFVASFARRKHLIPDFLVGFALSTAVADGASARDLTEAARDYARECDAEKILGIGDIQDPLSWLSGRQWNRLSTPIQNPEISDV